MLWIIIKLAASARIIIPATAIDSCGVSGGGTINRMEEVPVEGASYFGGTAKTMKTGHVHGILNHVGFDLSLPHHIQFTGQVHYLECRIYPSLPGPLIPKAYPKYANFGGTGK